MKAADGKASSQNKETKNGPKDDGKGQRKSPVVQTLETASGFLVDRSSLLRVLVQSLQDLGCNRSAAMIQEESGVCLEEAFITDLRRCVLQGDWTQLYSVLPKLQLTEDNHLRVLMLIAEQRFLELLEAGHAGDALKYLRQEIAPKHPEPARVNKLSSLIMYKDIDRLKQEAGWDGATGQSRHKLLGQLQALVPAVLLLPAGRLMTLLDQAIKHQVANCQFHNSRQRTVSLLQDHSCSLRIPHDLLTVLDQHEDEVICLQFSHDGTMLATGSKDKTVILWSYLKDKTFKALAVLKGHTGPVAHLAWSPDDKHLLTCAEGPIECKLWQVGGGQSLWDVGQQHTEPVSACAWLPDGKRFVTGGLDKRIVLWDSKGTALHTWTNEFVLDLAVTPDGNRLIAASPSHKLWIFNLVTKERERCLQETSPITSFCLSKDGKYALVNTTRPPQIHLWDLNLEQQDKMLESKEQDKERLVPVPVRTYTGLQQSRFVIRSCFGGTEESFILSGSEDGQVYIWHRHTGDLLYVLPGHRGTVNCLAWNSSDPTVFASASDDHTVRVWGHASGDHRSQVMMMQHVANGSSHADQQQHQNGKSSSQSMSLI